MLDALAEVDGNTRPVAVRTFTKITAPNQTRPDSKISLLAEVKTTRAGMGPIEIAIAEENHACSPKRGTKTGNLYAFRFRTMECSALKYRQTATPPGGVYRVVRKLMAEGIAVAE
jgi:hypothetical protein